MKIDMYNNIYFEKSPASTSESKDVFGCQLEVLVLSHHVPPHIQTTEELCKDYNTNIDNLPPIEVVQNVQHGCTHTDIEMSQSELFFICYAPENTL